MPTEVIMPALGMSQETGRLIAWHKKEGDSVKRGEIIMEIETDKTTVEVEANASGTLVNITAYEGDDIPVGQVIALIVAQGESAPSSSLPAKDTNGVKSATPVAMRVAQAHAVDLNQVASQGKRITRADVESFINGQEAPSAKKLLASPKARRLAQERGLELKVIAGTGPEGAVLAGDVLNYAPVTVDVVPTLPVQPVAQTSAMWQRMAEHLTQSWQTIPHFYLKREVSAEGLINWHKNLSGRVNIKITITDLLIKAVAAALRSHPHVNGQWTGDTVAFNEQINIGLAVAVEQGLLVPVIHNADQQGVTTIAKRRAELVERAQRGKFQPHDLQDGTFTISNLGMFGIDEFSAIVNPPQVAILAVGRISERVVPIDGQAVIRSMLTLTLSCDHRAVDGARGAQFLNTLAQHIENPLGLLD